VRLCLHLRVVDSGCCGYYYYCAYYSTTATHSRVLDAWYGPLAHLPLPPLPLVESVSHVAKSLCGGNTWINNNNSTLLKSSRVDSKAVI